MNKTAIKSFAVDARRKLIEETKKKAYEIGITENGIAIELQQSTNDLKFYDVGAKENTIVSGKNIKKRDDLIEAIKTKEQSCGSYKKAFEYIVDEVAYTWFNRLIAIRFMEVNDYLPSGVRVLSSNNIAKNEPDLVTNPFDSDLEYTDSERELIFNLKDNNKLDELFKMLFIKQCNSLHSILPVLFEETDDYTELLLDISFTNVDGIVHKLVNDIDEEDFKDNVEIIGWMYQYYISEEKDRIFAEKKKNKITKENIPAATQLFTPDWIVRYMVENSLGRFWLEGYPNEELQNNWKYYLKEAEQNEDVQAELDKIRAEIKVSSPEDIKFLEPAMGSGHILVYAFDVLYQIYISAGYSEREIPKLILEKNLYGLDIDDRAGQLAYFSLIMKARSYSRRLFRKVDEDNPIKVNICSIKESNGLTQKDVKYFANGDKELEKDLSYLVEVFTDAKEYGSILDVHQVNFDKIDNRLREIRTDITDLFNVDSRDRLLEILPNLIKQGKIISKKYHIICTNPPYLTVSDSSSKLQTYVKSNYPDSKTDLFAVFIESCKKMLVKNGLQAMITMHSWMFISSYEKLRNKILKNNIFINMAHLGARAFEEINGEVVQTTAFIMRDLKNDLYKGKFIRLVDFNSQYEKETEYFNEKNIYLVNTNNFKKIPGAPVAYWASKRIFEIFDTTPNIKYYASPRQGLATADNNRFVRLWYEVDNSKIGFDCESKEIALDSNKKWFPYNKGGKFRKWYGNNQYLVNWENDGSEIKAFKRSVIRNPLYYFKEGITWTFVSSSNFGVRYTDKGFLFDVGGSSLFPNKKDLYYILGLLSTKITFNFLRIQNPTLNFQVGNIANIPTIITDNVDLFNTINNKVKENIKISKKDWNSFETSWDFKTHPLIEFKSDTIENSYNNWSEFTEKQFNQLKSNEEELNRIFIDIYGLQDELTPEVEDKDVTIRKADKERDIKSFISYAVGCIFGRYSLDVEGLAYAGGEWDSEKYKIFIPDSDNCIPITDDEYFDDDIVGRFVEFVKIVFGEKTLEENLNFIADALGNKGNSSRMIIRNYFLNNFINDHNSTYKGTIEKRPIYWLFDSGKQNGFKALVYMHRWNADTIGNMRIEYLHRMQRAYEKEIMRVQDIIDTSKNNKEIKKSIELKEKLQKQLKETKDYDERVAHLALNRIDIDLDDGVKFNHEKVQTDPNGKNMKILAKYN